MHYMTHIRVIMCVVGGQRLWQLILLLSRWRPPLLPGWAAEGRANSEPIREGGAKATSQWASAGGVCSKSCTSVSVCFPLLSFSLYPSRSLALFCLPGLLADGCCLSRIPVEWLCVQTAATVTLKSHSYQAAETRSVNATADWDLESNMGNLSILLLCHKIQTLYIFLWFEFHWRHYFQSN